MGWGSDDLASWGTGIRARERGGTNWNLSGTPRVHPRTPDVVTLALGEKKRVDDGPEGNPGLVSSPGNSQNPHH